MNYAINILDNNKVKIKKFSLKQEELSFLLQDVLAQSRVKHPNIIQLYSIYHRENYAQLWLVEEDFGHCFYDIIRGNCPRSTQKWIDPRCSECYYFHREHDESDTDSIEENNSYFTSGTRLSEKSISKIIKQVLLALQLLHNEGKVHRNLHSKTIHINKESVVKIDRFFHNSNEEDEFDRKVILANHPLPSYIAPELLNPGCIYTSEIDLFSVGIFILELLESTTPLVELDRSEIFSTLSKNEITLPESASSCLKNFLGLVLCRKPSNRATIDVLLKHPFIVL